MVVVSAEALTAMERERKTKKEDKKWSSDGIISQQDVNVGVQGCRHVYRSPKSEVGFPARLSAYLVRNRSAHHSLSPHDVGHWKLVRTHTNVIYSIYVHTQPH